MGWTGSSRTSINCRAKTSAAITFSFVCLLAATPAANELPASIFDTQHSSAASNISGSILLVIPGGWDLAKPPVFLGQAIADMVQVRKNAVVVRSIELLPGRDGSAEVLVNFTLATQSTAAATRARAALREARLGETARELKAEVRMACFHDALGHCEASTEQRMGMPVSRTSSTSVSRNFEELEFAAARHGQNRESLSVAKRTTGRRSAFLAVGAMGMAVVVLMAAIIMVVSSFLKHRAKAERQLLSQVDKDDGGSDQSLQEPRLSVVCLLHV